MPTKISQLPAGVALTGVELVPVVQNATTIQTTVTAISTFVKAAFAASGGAALVGYLSPLTGAVARTVASKLGDVVSAKDFGAVGDGVTDDTTALQTCLNDLFLAGGGTMYLPRGTYKTTVILQIKPLCGIVGEGNGSLISFTPAAASTAVRLGVIPSSAVNVGMFLRNLKIQLNTDNSKGVDVIAGVHGAYENVIVASYGVNKGTTGWTLDGSNIGGYYNQFTNCSADHCHKGWVLATSGSTGMTSNCFTNCSVEGDYPTDATSIGWSFTNCGESSVLIGGDIADCNQGILQTGTCNTACFTWIGARFEGNGTDLQLNATGGTSGQVVMLGSNTLDPAKTNDNSGHTRNVLQFGPAGTIGVTGQAVTSGYTTVNAAWEGVVGLTVTGPAAGTCNARFYRDGKNITAVLDDFKPAGDSSATPFTLTGIPVGMQPASNLTETKLRVTDNGAYLSAPGMVRVETTNSFTIFATGGGASFTSSTNSTGWDSFSLTWRTA